MMNSDGARIGLCDPGRIAPGQFADIAIYDPATITDNATFADSHRFSSGVECVLVNGRVVWERDGPTGAIPGRVLITGRE